jgi:NitT/TauT family transport system permease protein
VPAERAGRAWAPALFLVALVVAWQALASAGAWTPWVFPSPADVARRLVRDTAEGRLPAAVARTLWRLLQGWGSSMIAGILLGALLRRVRLLGATVGALVTGLQALPSVCWLPLALLWFGLSERAILFVVIMGALLPMVSATQPGLGAVPPIYVRAARTMGARGLRLLVTVELPAALPSLLTGMRLGWAFAWRSLMAAEMIYASGGLGQLLTTGRDFDDLALVVAVMVVLVALGLAFERLVFAPAEEAVRERFGFAAA